MKVVNSVSLYDTDFFEWTQDTGGKIRNRRFEDIELTALAEEIEDLGKRDWSEVNSRLRVIILHLLKLQYQPEKKTDSWSESVGRERGVLEEIFDGSPSLIGKGRERLPITYKRAIRDAARETKLPQSTFPVDCPYTYEQILDHDFYPCDNGCN